MICVGTVAPPQMGKPTDSAPQPLALGVEYRGMGVGTGKAGERREYRGEEIGGEEMTAFLNASSRFGTFRRL